MSLPHATRPPHTLFSPWHFHAVALGLGCGMLGGLLLLTGEGGVAIILSVECSEFWL